MCACDSLVAVRLLPSWHLHHDGHDYGPGDVVYLDQGAADRIVERGHAEAVAGAATHGD